MRRFRKSAATLALILLGTLLAATLQAQSLADLARRERARKQRLPDTGKVYTNSDIGSLPKPENAPAPADAQAGNAQKAAEEAKTAAAKPAEPAGPSQADVEKEYRDKAAKLKENLAYEEKKLDVMQREMNLMQQQVYSDPNVALREQTFRTEINQRTQDIETQKASVEKAKQAFEDLEEELRKKGLPAGWAR